MNRKLLFFLSHVFLLSTAAVIWTWQADTSSGAGLKEGARMPATLAVATTEDNWFLSQSTLEQNSGRQTDGSPKSAIKPRDDAKSVAIVADIDAALKAGPAESLSIATQAIQGEVFGDPTQIGKVREGEPKPTYQFPSTSPSSLTWRPRITGLVENAHVRIGSCSQIPFFEEYNVLVTYEFEAKFTLDKDGKSMKDPRTLSVQLFDPTEVLVTTRCWTVVNRRNTPNLVPNPALKDTLYSRGRALAGALNAWIAQAPTKFDEKVVKVLRKNDYQPMTPLDARVEQLATADLGDGLRATWVAH